MTPQSDEKFDARIEPPRHQSTPTPENAAGERWEDEGGAMSRKLTTPPSAQASTAPSHRPHSEEAEAVHPEPMFASHSSVTSGRCAAGSQPSQPIHIVDGDL